MGHSSVAKLCVSQVVVCGFHQQWRHCNANYSIGALTMSRSYLLDGLLSVVGDSRHPPDSGVRTGSAVGIVRVIWRALQMDPRPEVQGYPEPIFIGRPGLHRGPPHPCEHTMAHGIFVVGDGAGQGHQGPRASNPSQGVVAVDCISALM